MEVQEKEVEYYETANGKKPFLEWLDSLKDRQARAKIRVRIDRVMLGNFGHCRAIGSGVTELKIDFGPGYRVYFGQLGNQLIILLCAGDKSTQSNDIKMAQEYWFDFRRDMKKRKNSYHEDLIEALRDPQEAVEYLKAALEESDMPEVFLLALRNVAEAQGIGKLSKRTKLNRENLYRALSKKGNPTLTSLYIILNALGMKLSIQSKEENEKV